MTLAEIQADFLTPEQYGEITQTPLSMVWRYCRQGLIPTLPRGKAQRRYRIPKSACEATTATVRADVPASNVTYVDFRERKVASL